MATVLHHFQSMPGNTFEEKFARGKVIFAELTGRSTDVKPGVSGFNDMAFANVFGDVWCRPGLSLKQRSYIVCSILIALGNDQELLFHFPGMLNQGYHPDQLGEMCLQLAYYAGWPRCVAAQKALATVLADEANKDIVSRARQVSVPARSDATSCTPSSTKSERFEEGKRVFHVLTGQDLSRLSIGDNGFGDSTFCNVFGDVWCRPGLNLTERLWCVIPALMALGQEEVLKQAYMPAFLRLGGTKEQLEEIALQVAHYAGWPRCVGARRAIGAVMKAQVGAKSKL